MHEFYCKVNAQYLQLIQFWYITHSIGTLYEKCYYSIFVRVCLSNSFIFQLNGCYLFCSLCLLSSFFCYKCVQLLAVSCKLLNDTIHIIWCTIMSPKVCTINIILQSLHVIFKVKISKNLIKKYYRDESLITLYLTIAGIIIPCLKSIG